MSQSEFALIGEAIAAALNSGLDDVDTATFHRLTLKEYSTLTSDDWVVDVIQKEHDVEPFDRTSRTHLYTFDVVMRRRFDRQADESTEVDPLGEVVELAEDELAFAQFAVNGNLASCTESRREPPYDPEQYAKGVFLSVITCTWSLNR